MIKQESRAYFKALGAQVTEMRKARGMTQAELARGIGVSQQAIFAYELGERRISVLVLAKLVKVFAVSVEEMVRESDTASATDAINHSFEMKLPSSMSATASGPPRAASISRSRASYSTCHRHVLW